MRETKVAVAGGRARGATRVVKTTSNQVEVQEHLPVVAFPCDEPHKFTGKYVTHMTPTAGTGLALAEQLVTTIRDRDIQVKVIVACTSMSCCGGTSYPTLTA